MSKNPNRLPMDEAKVMALAIEDCLKRHSIRCFMGGSVCRGVKQDVGDFDVVVSNLEDAVTWLVHDLNGVANFPKISKGIGRTATVRNGLTIELMEANTFQWGAMQLFATGNGIFNISMRSYAKAHGFKLNQYGLWRRSGSELVASRTEASIFRALGLRFIKPAEREVEKISLWNFKHKKGG